LALLAWFSPSFLSSSPATEGSPWTGAVKEISAGLVRPAAQRGHGPARLDGTRPRATVADKVMKSGETAGQGNGPSTRRPHGKRSAQARSWKPGRRRQPSGARERWKLDRGETPQAARCAIRTTARPAISQGPGTPSLQCSMHKLMRQSSGNRFDSDCRGLADPAQPVRRSMRGAKHRAAGIARRAFPWRASRRRAGIAPRGRDAKGRPATP